MELKSLNEVFEKSLFRIPDYQRGYSWSHEEQLRDFWEDLINLEKKRSHYTGMLTLKRIDESEFSTEGEEYWLLDDHDYKAYHVVDGQQRLTTCVILIQAIVDIIKHLPEHKGKSDDDIFIGSLSLNVITENYLVKKQPPHEVVKTYKFGYTTDNPSFRYLRNRIFQESDNGTIQETFYTLNLQNAMDYFKGQLINLVKKEGSEGLRTLYKKLTQQLKFNEYVIGDDLDVYVAFETMNNRGKKLSGLELLKNRLIYLTTLYPSNEIEENTRAQLREQINNAWKEIYYQLGRNKTQPLRDDDFLRAHWIMYFKYTRNKGDDYIRDLMNVQFSTKKIHEKKEVALSLQKAQEVAESFVNDDEIVIENEKVKILPKLTPGDLEKYVLSIKESAKNWFFTWFPFIEMEGLITDEEKQWIDKLNRIGMVYFRPLIMSILNKVESPKTRLDLFRKIERYIFIVFRMSNSKSNFRNSVFYNAAREFYHDEIKVDNIEQELEKNMDWAYDDDKKFKTHWFKDILQRKFDKKGNPGYYDWNSLRYFLYEYELELASERNQNKIDWKLFIKSKKDKISIEHILPQTANHESWQTAFNNYDEEDLIYWKGSLGNLLPLSLSINSSLQNDSFEDKKKVRKNKEGQILRHGYRNGSYSEIEVSENDNWSPEEILQRGLRLLTFMEKRWNIEFKSDLAKVELLFLDFDEVKERYEDKEMEIS